MKGVAQVVHVEKVVDMNLESELLAFPGSVRVRRLFSVVQVKLKNLSRAPAVAAGQMLKVRVSWVCSAAPQGKRTGTITSCAVVHRRVPAQPL